MKRCLQNKTGTVFKGVTVLTLAKATQVTRPRPCGPGSLTTTEGRGEAAEKAGPGHLAACCVPIRAEDAQDGGGDEVALSPPQGSPLQRSTTLYAVSRSRPADPAPL